MFNQSEDVDVATMLSEILEENGEPPLSTFDLGVRIHPHAILLTDRPVLRAIAGSIGAKLQVQNNGVVDSYGFYGISDAYSFWHKSTSGPQSIASRVVELGLHKGLRDPLCREVVESRCLEPYGLAGFRIHVNYQGERTLGYWSISDNAERTVGLCGKDEAKLIATMGVVLEG